MRRPALTTSGRRRSRARSDLETPAREPLAYLLIRVPLKTGLRPRTVERGVDGRARPACAARDGRRRKLFDIAEVSTFDLPVTEAFALVFDLLDGSVAVPPEEPSLRPEAEKRACGRVSGEAFAGDRAVLSLPP